MGVKLCSVQATEIHQKSPLGRFLVDKLRIYYIVLLAQTNRR
jgi:hypothetical protein